MTLYGDISDRQCLPFSDGLLRHVLEALFPFGLDAPLPPFSSPSVASKSASVKSPGPLAWIWR